MDRNENTNEGGSSPDTVIARSSSEEEKRKSVVASTSGEYITVGDSSSSLDTLTGGSVATLSSSANADDRKKGKFGAFKSSLREGNLFKIKKKTRETDVSSSFEAEQRDKEISQQQQSQRLENEKEPKLTTDALSSAALKKKKKKSHSLVRKLSLNKFRMSSEQQEPRHTPEGGNSSRSQSQSSQESPVHTYARAAKRGNDDALEREEGVKEEIKKPEKLEKSTKTVGVAQRNSPSLPIKSFAGTVQQAAHHQISPDTERQSQQENQDNASPFDKRCSSTLPYALSRWPEPSETKPAEDPAARRGKLEEERKDKVRHISVRTFDTFSTFDNTLDEEDFSEDYDNTGSNYRRLYNVMAPVAAVDHLESSSNNAPNLGVSEKREHLYKILVIGELGAGKTSIIKRYVHQFFSQHYRATIGVDFALKVLNWDPHTIIRLQLWDIAGQERFGNMTRVYYKEAVGAFIVFDVTRSATLEAVVKWKQDLDSKVQLPDGSAIPCVLLANKCDQQKEGLVNSPAKMDEYCKEKNFSGWFETSAKENINIEEAAKFLVNKILQNDQVIKDNGVQDQTDSERFALNQSPTSSKKSCSC
ncbi:RAS oncogene family member Rab32 isoform X3 [Temnothorax americanus]|uniref:RAS oncogene family member Rab32 isoform X3 n=1 Tax=Temnothorax americanus TaxID=1964332 RepID=UPI00406806CA